MEKTETVIRVKNLVDALKHLTDEQMEQVFRSSASCKRANLRNDGTLGRTVVSFPTTAIGASG